MLKKLYGKEETPEWLSNKLTEMMFTTAPSAFMVHMGGIVIAALILCWRSQDVWIAVAAVIGILLSLYRGAVFYFFRQRNRDRNCARSNDYWTLLYAYGGWCYSLDTAALMARTLFVGETISIAVAVVVVSGYLVGLIIRASTIPRFAVPQLCLVFGPLIGVAVSLPDRGYLAVALLLVLSTVGCVGLVLAVHGGIKGQLLAEHQLALLALTDHLTGLANRASLDTHGASLLQHAHASRCSHALALIDLDGFKSVNDIYGHAAGDELLKEVSIRIKAVLDGRHFPARLGGDEFAIVFDKNTELEGATTLSNQIVNSLQRPFEIAGATLQISGSAGVARLEGSQDTFASIMERADKALYLAKNAGRNQVQVLVTVDLSPSIIPAALSPAADFPPVGAMSALAFASEVL